MYPNLEQICFKSKDLTQAAVSEFKDKYLSELSKVSNGNQLVTDKMPHNFLFVPLICAAFPAKIIHVQRKCSRYSSWSNYKQYFSQALWDTVTISAMSLLLPLVHWPGWSFGNQNMTTEFII